MGRLKFDVRDIKVDDAVVLFTMLLDLMDDDNANKKKERVDFATFVNGCMRLRGAATCMDMHALQMQMKQVSESQAKTLRVLRRTFLSDLPRQAAPQPGAPSPM